MAIYFFLIEKTFEVIVMSPAIPILFYNYVYCIKVTDSSTVPKYPSLKFWELGVILGTVKSGLEKLQIRSKTCQCVRNLVNTRLMFANTLEKLKMVDMEDDLIHLMVLRRKTPGKYHSSVY